MRIALHCRIYHAYGNAFSGGKLRRDVWFGRDHNSDDSIDLPGLAGVDDRLHVGAAPLRADKDADPQFGHCVQLYRNGTQGMQESRRRFRLEAFINARGGASVKKDATTATYERPT